MKTKINDRRQSVQGYALVTVLVIGAVGLLILAGSLRWTTSNANLIARNNQYFASLSAAEAATEAVISQITLDFQKQGPATVASKLATYSLRVPTSAESSYWGKFTFSNGQGGANVTAVTQTAPWTKGVALIKDYEGLVGDRAIYSITSNAKQSGAQFNITAGVGQELWIEYIPLFQFAIFYNLDLEINPGPDMTISGKVHSNGQIYLDPQASLVFNGDVAAVKDINYNTPMPGDPLLRTKGTISKGPSAVLAGGADSLNLPIGTDNSPDTVRQIVEPPPVGELLTSDLAKERFYNKADLVIVIGPTGTITAKSGSLALNTSSATVTPTTLPWTSIKTFVKTNVTFYNKREGKTVQATEIDVGLLKTWNSSGNTLKTALGRDVNSIYVDDQRPKGTGFQSGVRLVNGATLPSLGLTVATPDPLYVQGNYNAPSSANLGTSNTTGTKPAALIGDSINVLSKDWSDSDSALGIGNRTAGDTTVNAAFLGGIVPTGNGYYSGGVENFPRFLEDWDDRVFTYNGSMIVMFPSKVALAPWGGSDVYSPPTRHWNFDTAFLDPNRLPPGTPSSHTVTRGSYKILPGT
jgi:hypothetical protein